jgi:glycerophosphoryl diester phosphodiesterase
LLVAGALLSGRFSSPPPFPSFEIHGHRVAAGPAPPGNLLDAFLIGIEQKATSLEADLRIAKDGTVVLNHDKTLSKECSFSSETVLERRISEMTRDEILAARCLQSDGRSQSPLLLSDLLNLHDRGNFGFNLEIKSTAPDAALKILARVLEFNAQCDDCLDGRVIFQSFHEPHLKTLNARLHKEEGERPHRFRLSQLTAQGSAEDLRRVAPIIHIYSAEYTGANDLALLVRAAKPTGLRVIPWTVNEAPAICEAARVGADGVITDYPDRATEIAALIATLGRRPKNCQKP